MPSPKLVELPREILFNIFDFLNLDEANNLALCSKTTLEHIVRYSIDKVSDLSKRCLFKRKSSRLIACPQMLPRLKTILLWKIFDQSIHLELKCLLLTVTDNLNNHIFKSIISISPMLKRLEVPGIFKLSNTSLLEIKNHCKQLKYLEAIWEK